MLGTSISKNSLLLAVFALIAAGMPAIVNEVTRERIQQEMRAAQQRALFEILPESRHDNDLLADTLDIPAEAWPLLGLKDGGKMHVARARGEVIALIIPAVAPDGYSGDISLIVGVNRDGSVAGVRVLSHRETPGLGDKLEVNKDDWILSLNDRSLQNPGPQGWNVKKEGGVFDQFTGATITPRAVLHQVRRVLEFVQAYQETLFPPAAPTPLKANADD